MAKNQRDWAAQEAKRLNEQYGGNSGFTGRQTRDITRHVIPTGILGLDYALGTGGYVGGAPVEVFGPEDIGKSSAVGLSGVRSGQATGHNCGIIALEPTFDADWAEKNGVDLDNVAIAYPDNGEIAFEILHDWVSSKVIDFVLFDSIGAVGSESESEGGKAKVGGNSKLITEGIRRIVMRAWKNKVAIVWLNQIRDAIGATNPYAVNTPGGHAIKHFSPVRIQIKPGPDRWDQKIDGNKVTIGRSLNATIVRNKLSEGTGHRAMFNYFQMEYPGFPFGLDVAADVTNTAVTAGVFKKNGGWYSHSVFGEKPLNGAKKIGEFLTENPKAYEQIRQEVLEKMIEKAGTPLNATVEEEDDDG